MAYQWSWQSRVAGRTHMSSLESSRELYPLYDPQRARWVTVFVKQLGRWISTFSWCPVSVPSHFWGGEAKRIQCGAGGC